MGLDDTDSAAGGCTTWVLSELIGELAHRGGPDLIGPPRLVRLNPGVPWKTRGNAALAARFGHGRGKGAVVGSFRGQAVRAFARGRRLRPREVDELWTTALAVLRRASRWGDPGADPTVVLSDRPLPPELYWSAVRGVVAPGWTLDRLAECKEVRVAAFGSGQGVVGAAAALAWPRRRRTWEAIAYRRAVRWGTARSVDVERVRRVERAFPETFLSRDETTRRTLVAPHTPCPILYGVRGRRPERLLAAVRALRGPKDEVPDRVLLFETNQASGDHLVERAVAAAAPGTSGIFRGVVVAPPRLLPGGHVRFALEDPTGRAECLAFEPTRALPAVSRELVSGDELRCWGSVPWEGPAGTVHLEGLQLLRARPRWEKRENPRCPRCGGRMGSWGRGKGYRCRACRALLPPEAAPAARVGRTRWEGAYLPTPSARRHLSPLGVPRPARASLGDSHIPSSPPTSNP